MNFFSLSIVTLGFVATAMAIYRDMEPVDDERLEVLQEIFSACFVPAATSTEAVHSIKFLETHFGYISRSGVNYVFATLGYTDEETKEQLRPLLLTSHRPPEIKIKAKMVKRNLLRKMDFDRRQPMKIVQVIEEETGTILEKTRAYIEKYSLGE